MTKPAQAKIDQISSPTMSCPHCIDVACHRDSILDGGQWLDRPYGCPKCGWSADPDLPADRKGDGDGFDPPGANVELDLKQCRWIERYRGERVITMRSKGYGDLIFRGHHNGKRWSKWRSRRKVTFGVVTCSNHRDFSQLKKLSCAAI
jgi:predicted RNA-binding Zn-ribbon protein involved in translation (DUF1610 family)